MSAGFKQMLLLKTVVNSQESEVRSQETVDRSQNSAFGI
jgi:hypothetical protein